MQAFDFYAPTRVLFGPGRETEVGRQIRAFGGSKVLLVYGGQSAIASGLIDRVQKSMDESELSYKLLGGVRPNPRLDLVRKGIEEALSFGSDFLLAVGGGSVIDTAKAIANGAANPKVDVWDFWMQKNTLRKSLPVGAISTISATGSEMSDSSVITNEETGEKRGLNTDIQRPKFAILNPELTFTVPSFQISCGVVDIMMHTMDRYFNPVTSNDLTDEIAEGLLRVTIRNGKKALKNSHDYQVMSELMWAASLSHNGLTGLGGKKDFAPHQLGHELSARFDLAHGASLSSVWGSWARYSMDTDYKRFIRFGENVWGLSGNGGDDKDRALKAIDTTVSFFHSLNMPTCFKEAGIGLLSHQELEDLAHRCTFYGKRTIGTFRRLGYEDVLAIYSMANH